MAVRKRIVISADEPKASAKEKSSAKETMSDSKLSKIRSLLHSDEKYVNHYHAGLYTIVESNTGLTFSRRWPRVFLKIPFNEIRRLEYFTKVDWLHLIKFMIYSAIAVFLFLRPKLLWEKFIGFYFPFVTRLLALDKPFNYLVVSYGIMIIFAILSFVALVKFVSWIIGRLTIEASKRIEPLEIISWFSDDVKNLLRDLEPKIKKKVS